MNLFNGTGQSQYVAPVENRVLVYEKDGQTLKPIKIYYDAQGRRWVEARNNAKFVIEVRNNYYDTYEDPVEIQ